MNRVLLALVLSAPAHAISRVGAHLTDEVDGFTTPLPRGTRGVESVNDIVVRVFISRVGSLGGEPAFGQMTFFEARRFRDEYPKLADLSRKDFVSYLEAEQWQALPVPNACIEARLNRSDTASFAIVTWGGGRGVVFVGEKTFEIEEAIGSLVNGLVLNEGACAWSP